MAAYPRLHAARLETQDVPGAKGERMKMSVAPSFQVAPTLLSALCEDWDFRNYLIALHVIALPMPLPAFWGKGELYEAARVVEWVRADYMATPEIRARLDAAEQEIRVRMPGLHLSPCLQAQGTEADMLRMAECDISRAPHRGRDVAAALVAAMAVPHANAAGAPPFGLTPAESGPYIVSCAVNTAMRGVYHPRPPIEAAISEALGEYLPWVEAHIAALRGAIRIARNGPWKDHPGFNLLCDPNDGGNPVGKLNRARDRASGAEWAIVEAAEGMADRMYREVLKQEEAMEGAALPL